ncbi:SDR family NAD(P)-dependent oxidoreductase [Methylobacterium nodulans]|uniref:NADP-dependent 3-hydroxy acid dehydrogenase YdfG n=1 Tax=Methylobacterium nodulans (strain LMG 21967 / CNCM I-2342 / ORS 2060) TaxID=460265 RepID=B8II05_METNO|nr:SDR family oxidoreductase [Methylobacterium nodulans]ACL56043.1 short-chain dehydrogenase/reductase SDR [Methylobacterium nodulans ORS 2060]
MTTERNSGTALVTGASAGIGAVYADRLAARGHDLILVARNAARLQAVAEGITARHGRAVGTIAADLTDPAQLAGVETVLRTDDSLTMLVNNAGFGAAAPLLASDVERMAAMIAVNVTAVMRLTYAAVPGLVARGGGTLINIASIVAIGPEILNGVYGGSKAFVLAFSQSLRKELGQTGVRVQAVLPGATGTEFWEIAGNPLGNLPESWVMTPGDMVDAALAGLDAGEFVTIPALPDAGDWEAYEAARQQMLPHLSNARPAARYGLPRAAA